MEFFICILIGFTLFVSVFIGCLVQNRPSTSSSSHANLPPGKFGLPYIGETLEFLRCGWNGHPEKFINDRIAKYTSRVFKTSIIAERTIVLSGAAGNKFLFSNENKLVKAWWPITINKIFIDSYTQTTSKEESVRLWKMLSSFLKPEALMRYVGIMDSIAQKHFEDSWEGKEKVTVLPLAKIYTLWIAAKVFLSIEEPDQIAKLRDPFFVLSSGMISVPIDLPGTTFNGAVKASKVIRKDLRGIIEQRKIDLAENKASPTQDILSHLLLATDENGKHAKDSDIADLILALLVGGHDSASTVITCLVKYLSQSPSIYGEVLKEQIEIAKSKSPGELLNWEDLRKMKYSWNVACEVMRLAPPAFGGFREAIDDFIFDGFSVPKSWKLYWSASSTHMNPEYFPNPENFDPTRFEGNGPAPYTYVPFGGGPRMCPGKAFARLEILVFIHNLVKRFNWEKLISNDKIVMAPLPIPTKGLPVRLIPHNA